MRDWARQHKTIVMKQRTTNPTLEPVVHASLWYRSSDMRALFRCRRRREVASQQHEPEPDGNSALTPAVCQGQNGANRLPDAALLGLCKHLRIRYQDFRDRHKRRGQGDLAKRVWNEITNGTSSWQLSGATSSTRPSQPCRRKALKGGGFTVAFLPAET